MLNRTHLLKLYVRVHEKSGKKIVLPLLLHLQSLQSYLDDLADVAGLFPENAIVGGSRNKNFTMGGVAAVTRTAANVIGDLHGFRTNVKVKEKDGNRIRVDIHAM